MKSLLWRVVYVVIVVVILSLVLPPFLAFMGIGIPADAYQLIKLCLVIIAILYVFFGPEPRALF